MLVQVDIDPQEILEQFSDDELLAEIEEREIESEHDWEGLYAALCNKNHILSDSIIRAMVEHELGRIVP